MVENGVEQVYLVPIELEQQPQGPSLNYDEQGNQILTFNTKEEYDEYVMQVQMQ